MQCLHLTLKCCLSSSNPASDGCQPQYGRVHVLSYLPLTQRATAVIRRMGVWGDWEAPYLTLDPAYEAAQLEVFGKNKVHITTKLRMYV